MIILKQFGFIKFSAVKDEIKKAVALERARVEREYEGELSKALLDQQEVYDMKVAALEAEIDNILAVNKTLREYRNDAEKAYKSYRENATNFDSLCVNLVNKVNMILANATDTFRTVHEIKDMSADYIRVLKGKDRNVSRLLRLPEIKD